MSALTETDSRSHSGTGQHAKESPQSAASEAVDPDFYLLTENATKAQKGNAAASEAALREVLNMKNGGYLKDVAQDLEKSGQAKITYGKNGDVEHIIFNSSDGKSPADIDPQHETVNGKSSAQIKEEEIKQAKEYLAAGLSDPEKTDASHRPLSPEGQAAAKELMGALLDGDVAAMTKAGQQIMKNPEMTASIQSVLNQIYDPPPISFGKGENGQPLMQVTASGDFDALIVPASGPASAATIDVWGKRDPSGHPNLDATMKSASEHGLTQASSAIDQAEGYLEMVDRLPADGYTNMLDLERQYSAPHSWKDIEKLDERQAKDLSDMTPDERAYFDKIHKGGHVTNDEDEREEEEQQQGQD